MRISGVKMKQLVISVHGIRTFGSWQERLERLLLDRSSDRELTVINYKYGYLSIIAFILPFMRWIVVRRFRNFLAGTVQREQWDRIDLVGHSFGTHLIGWALHGLQDVSRPPVHVLMAGSVLKSNFAWQPLMGRSVQRVVNECGIEDNVLVLNQMTVLFTGMAGRDGFTGMMGGNFYNRWFRGGHSHSFDVVAKSLGIQSSEVYRKVGIAAVVSRNEAEWLTTGCVSHEDHLEVYTVESID